MSWLSKSVKDSGADVKIGDELVAIDGKTPSGVTGANTLLFGKAETIAMVKLKRNGKDMEVPVTRVQKSS